MSLQHVGGYCIKFKMVNYVAKVSYKKTRQRMMKIKTIVNSIVFIFIIPSSENF